MKKEIVYYTDSKLDKKILKICQQQLLKSGLPIICVSRKPMDFARNIVVEGKWGSHTMFRQILAGLEESDADIIFFAEHDVLYHPSHFDFIPPRKDRYYYNINMYRCDMERNHCVKVEDCRMTSGLCAYRDILLEHYRKRVKIYAPGVSMSRMGYEPGVGRIKEMKDYRQDTWKSEEPNIDIRHKRNFSGTKWKPEQFRNKKFTKGWTETTIPIWYNYEKTR